jgi:hypothetical protein
MTNFVVPAKGGEPEALVPRRNDIKLTIANGAPVVATKICGFRFSRPIDGGLRFFDGHPVFGPSKTIRGVTGDLFSSFVKRRLGFAASSRATGLDHIPESLFPLLTARCYVPLSGLDVLIGVSFFTVGSVALSPLFHRVGLRNRPF